MREGTPVEGFEGPGGGGGDAVKMSGSAGRSSTFPSVHSKLQLSHVIITNRMNNSTQPLQIYVPVLVPFREFCYRWFHLYSATKEPLIIAPDLPIP